MIGFAGLSHLGIVSSIAVASKGFEVTAYDQRADLCDDLARQRLPVLEPDLPELLSVGQARLRFTADPTALRACDVIFFSLDVPTDPNNRSDLSGLRRLIEEVVIYAKSEAILALLSQVPPGFTRRLCTQLQPILDQRRLRVFYQVETLIFGRAVERALRPERYIVGCDDPKVELPKPYAELLASFGCPVLRMRYESAELAKISIKMFLAASLSATNSLAELCEVIGAEWTEIVSALRLDRRIGPHAYLAPGLGIAGGEHRTRSGNGQGSRGGIRCRGVRGVGVSGKQPLPSRLGLTKTPPMYLEPRANVYYCRVGIGLQAQYPID